MGDAHVSLDPEIFDGLILLSRSTGVSVEELLEEACHKLLSETKDNADTVRTEVERGAFEAEVKS